MKIVFPCVWVVVLCGYRKIFVVIHVTHCVETDRRVITCIKVMRMTKISLVGLNEKSPRGLDNRSRYDYEAPAHSSTVPV